MDISKLDYWAYSGTSILHRAGAASKMSATALVIASVVVSRELWVLACLLGLVLATARGASLPVGKVAVIAFFPSLFALIFAVSYVSSGWETPAVIMLKAVTASSSMVLLISTTPYTDIAGTLGRFLPRVIADGLFMTYRSFFILIKLMDDFVDALRLRGGMRRGSIVATARNMASGMGMLFVRAYDKSQRLYEVMCVRGYSGRLSAAPVHMVAGYADLPYTAAAAAMFALAAAAAWGAAAPGPAVLVPALLGYIVFMEAVRSWKK